MRTNEDDATQFACVACAYACVASNLDSRALLHMTARERRDLGNPDTIYVCDWFATGTMQTLVIGQFKYAGKIELMVREALWKAQLTWRKKKIDAMTILRL